MIWTNWSRKKSNLRRLTNRGAPQSLDRGAPLLSLRSFVRPGRQDFPQGFSEPRVVIVDRHFHAFEPALFQTQKEILPRAGAFTVGQFHGQNLPSPFQVDANGDHHRPAAYRSAITNFFITGIENRKFTGDEPIANVYAGTTWLPSLPRFLGVMGGSVCSARHREPSQYGQDSASFRLFNMPHPSFFPPEHL